MLPTATAWWMGAYGAGGGAVFRARGDEVLSAWASSFELAFATRWTRGRFFVEGRVGAAATLPPLRATGGGSTLRYTIVRPAVNVALGVDFGT